LKNTARVGYHPIVDFQIVAYLASMKNRIIATWVVTLALALSFLLVGCAREISHEKRTTVGRDGTVKSQERTVTQLPDGTVTRTDESKKISP
jgi:hypothetical protein